MTDRELMQQALEALEEFCEHQTMLRPIEKRDALRERLAQPEQEPFGYFQLDLRLDAWVQNRHSNKGVAFYTTPPRREWVGLTDEVDALAREMVKGDKSVNWLARAIEAKLKEKNSAQ